MIDYHNKIINNLHANTVFPYELYCIHYYNNVLSNEGKCIWHSICKCNIM